jgi:hypothetical protein
MLSQNTERRKYMEKQKCNLANVALNTHIVPLSTSEVSEVKGGFESNGNSLEKLCRYFQKLLHGN